MFCYKKYYAMFYQPWHCFSSLYKLPKQKETPDNETAPPDKNTEHI